MIDQRLPPEHNPIFMKPGEQTMHIKKSFLFAFVLLSIFLSSTTFAQDTAYEVELDNGLTVQISFPDTYDVFTRDLNQHADLLEKYNLNKVDLQNDMHENGIYLKAINTETGNEILFISFSNQYSETLPDYKMMSQEELDELLNKWKMYDDNTAIYKNDPYVFISTYISDKPLLSYLTVQSKQYIDIVVSTFTDNGTLTLSDTDDLRQVVDSFTVLPEPQHTAVPAAQHTSIPATSYNDFPSYEELYQKVYLFMYGLVSWIVVAVISFLVLFFYFKLQKKPVPPSPMQIKQSNGMGGIMVLVIIRCIFGLIQSLGFSVTYLTGLDMAISIIEIIWFGLILYFIFRKQRQFLIIYILHVIFALVVSTLTGAYTNTISIAVIEGLIITYMLLSHRVAYVFKTRPIGFQ